VTILHPVTHPERIDPEDTGPGILAIHLSRYELVAPSCAGAEVLDAACGVGYGTAHLSKVAERVVGVDLDPEAIALARARYQEPNVAFEQMDVQSLRFPDASFDVVCSFETVEHADDPEAAIAEAARVLRPDGIYAMSTPRVETTTYAPANPFHRVELSRADLEEMLRKHFDHVELQGQVRRRTMRHRILRRLDVFGLRRRLGIVRRLSGVITGTAALEVLTRDDLSFAADAADVADDLVAICTSPRRRQPAGV
jgi:O-antigen biosynthesis protein